MIRLAWLQSRMQTAAAGAGLLIMAALLAYSGPHLTHLYQTTVADCAAHNDCSTVDGVFLRHDNTLRILLGYLVVIVPGVVGVFWGAPLVARELESGTARLAWTQSVTRTRWLAMKLAVGGVACVAIAGLVSLMVTWWASPLDKVAADQFGFFDQRDIVPLGYAAFAFALGVTAGMLIKRTVPAMGATLVAFAAVRIADTYWLRAHLVSPVHASSTFAAASQVGFAITSIGVTFVAGAPIVANGMVLSSRIADRAGHTASAQTLHRFLAQHCPAIAKPPPTPAGGGSTAHAGPGNQAVFNHCVASLSGQFHMAVSYDPPSSYWTLQWYETGIFIALAAALAGLCLWWVRERLA